MGLIEAWGTGLRKIQTEAENYHLSPPEIMENADSFRINLYRVGEKPIPDGENSEKDGENIKSGSEKATRSSVLSVNANELSAKKAELSVKNIGVVGEKAHMMDRMITKLTDYPKATATALSEELSISKRTADHARLTPEQIQLTAVRTLYCRIHETAVFVKIS